MPGYFWTQKQDFGPKARVGHSVAYDSDRKQTILFGGDSMNNQLFNDTWEWDGNYWTQMSDIGVSARRDHAMAYDATRQKTTIFGGTDNNKKFGDTWIWDGEDWTQISNSGPQPRSGHGLVYNNATKTIILFGGESATGVLGDTWEFDGTEWTQKDDSGPSARKFHVMCYDSSRDRLVLFGGTENLSGLGDTWEWDGTAWTQTADFGPTPCLKSAMVFTNSHSTLFGGINSIDTTLQTFDLINNSWEWDGKHWTQKQDIGPGSRCGHSVVFDTNRKTIVLFGGESNFVAGDQANEQNDVLADTWEHVDTEVPSSTQQNNISIVSFVLNPDFIAASQVVGGQITGIITISAPAPSGGLAIPVGIVSQSVWEALPQGSLLSTVTTIIVPENAEYSYTTFPPRVFSNVTQSSYVVCLYDPLNTGNYAAALLTITDN
jgi:hypothetical protein